VAEPMPVGVVGVGHLGSLHAGKYAARDDAELVSVYDTDVDRASAVARTLGCATAGTLAELLSACRAVSIAVPVVAHEEVGLAAIAAGCHVLMEKPLAASLAAGERLVAASEAARVLLQVGHIERFNPVIRDLHHIVSRPRFVECHRLAPFAGRGTDTDVVLDVMIHDLDLLAYLVNDEVVSVDAVGVPVLSRNVDIANVRIRFQQGCVANVTASRVSLKKERKLRIFQEDTYVSMDFDARSALIARRDPAAAPGVVDMSAIGVEVREFGAADPLAAEIDAFLAAVRGKVAPGVAAREALDALRLAERIRHAMELPGGAGSESSR